MNHTFSKLESDRSTLLQALANTGDMRRGSITEVYRSCGKPTCACADDCRYGFCPRDHALGLADGSLPWCASHGGACWCAG